MILRRRHIDSVLGLLRTFPVVALIGARQVGKTTLSQQLAEQWPGETTVFDLEDPVDLARLSEPTLVLSLLKGLVVLDEIQRAPDLFQILRVLVDRSPDRRFLVLGSASPDLLRQTSETLAGRLAYCELSGFTLDEVGVGALDDLWLRGGFPRSFLADSLDDSVEWRRQFIRTFLERDIPQLGFSLPAQTMRHLWTMLSHYHGQVLNLSALSRSLGVSDTTIRRWVDILESAFVVFRLAPWHENLKKRQIRSPKVYLSDTGLLHTLLGLSTLEDLQGHPKVGTSFEGFAVAQLIRRLRARPEEMTFWGTHAGAELDLLLVRGSRRVGFEFKRTAAPRRTRSMAVAMTDLKLDRLHVIHAGEHAFPLGHQIDAVPISRVFDTDIDLS